MEIRAKGVLDYESIKALTRLQMFGKRDPRKRMRSFSILFSILLFLILVEMFLFGVDGTLILLLGCAVLCIVLECFLYFIMPKIQYNSLMRMQNFVNEYTFTENAVYISTNNENYNSQGEVKYSLLVKVYETSKHLFIFQNKAQAYIIDKATMVGGSKDELREKIANQMSGKYILCKY